MSSGTIVETPTTFTVVKKRSILWTSTAGGAVSQPLALPSPAFDGVLYRVVFIPGTGGVQPTNLYTVQMLDDYGVDMLQAAGVGGGLSNTAAVDHPFSTPVAYSGGLTLTVAAAGNAKQGTVVLFYTGNDKVTYS